MNEKKIIEIFMQSGRELRKNAIVDNSDVNTQWLLAFANALHDDFIKSLGEPVAEVRVRNGETLGFISKRENREKLLLGQKLYALPNDK